jgi:hypothetical protein
MEAARLSNWQEGSAKDEPEVQAPLAPAMERQRSQAACSLAKANTPTGVISLKMERPPASIVSKAQYEGISLRPTNRSPYNHRKPAKKARR